LIQSIQIRNQSAMGHGPEPLITLACDQLVAM
jgi:hypothetical protein